MSGAMLSPGDSVMKKTEILALVQPEDMERDRKLSVCKYMMWQAVRHKIK